MGPSQSPRKFAMLRSSKQNILASIFLCRPAIASHAQFHSDMAAEVGKRFPAKSPNVSINDDEVKLWPSSIAV